jgi:subtilisin family serine protease
MKNPFRNLLMALTAVVLSPALFAAKVPGRYIVELSTEPVTDYVAQVSPGVRMQSAPAVSHRARIRSEQQLMRLRIEQQQARVLGSVDTVANALFVEIPDSEAALLAGLPGVKRIYPVRTMHMLLDRAVILHKVAEAWDQVGADRAGAGMKIAILDSGIDVAHPGFQDATLTAPASFPKTNLDSDAANTSGKVIVARSYVSMLPNRDPDLTARDRVGHGTALAMIAAGVRNAGPLATITGVAPKAYLGNYKVFGTPGFNDSTTDDVILKAIDDAVADGMDVISMSFGSDLAPRLADDPEAQAVERATRAGVIVVAAAGNDGPDLNTLSSPATAPSAIAVGATTNDRTFSESVEVAGLSHFIALAGDGPAPAAPLTAAIADVASLDGNGQACATLGAGSLTGRIALILRGICTFETKLNNAQRAGAVAAIVYAAQDSPSPIYMAVGLATLPAEMIGYDAGIAIKNALAGGSSTVATLRFTPSAVSQTANQLTDFSAAGPNVDAGIKPDLMAVGRNMYTATQTFDPNGDMYDSTGYVLVDGTSFSTPFVAGAAALLKAARPGLSADQYRSLLINSAAAVQARNGQAATVQQAGGGLLDLSAALRSTVTANPVSLSFGSGGTDAQVSRTLTLTNIGGASDTFSIAVSPRSGDVVPTVAASTVELAAGASVDVPVSWSVSGVNPGAYEGAVAIAAGSTGAQIKLPYWYAATSDPARVTTLDAITSGRRGSNQRDAALFRITDSSGVALAGIQPDVSVVSGGGTVRAINSYDSDIPGLFGIDVQLGPAAGTNVFRIQAGNASLDITITGR